MQRELQLTRTPAITLTGIGLLQRKCACGSHTQADGQCDACKKQRMEMQRKASNQHETSDIPSVVYEALRSPGQELDAQTRSFMEPRFGRDFSGVRIHTDTKASESAQAVNALAYTVGRNVVFGAGQYQPSTLSGKSLIAHELTHVIQQSGPGDRITKYSRPLAAQNSEPAETEAETIAKQIVQNRPTPLRAPAVSPRPNALMGKAREKLGTAFSHSKGKKSSFKSIKGNFDGRKFKLTGDTTSLMNVDAQSGRPYTVKAKDAKDCKGSASDCYMNDPRYVGIQDNGPIPEGSYFFFATSMATFDTIERHKMLLGGNYVDPFGASLHGGDWGAGRVALNKISVKASKFCGDTNKRSGFYLHGGIMPGSSGCIDIGNSGVGDLVKHLDGYTGKVAVDVDYKHPAPGCGPVDRMLGRFTYGDPEKPKSDHQDLTLWDRLKAAGGF